MPVPLFVCHANCCRSVMAQYLFENLCPGTMALSAGVECGFEINSNAMKILQQWGIDARDHQPRQLDRAICNRADAIFTMGPEYTHRLLLEYGVDLAEKSYFFADPFTLPDSLANHAFFVRDPSFDDKPIGDLVKEFFWFRERVVQIHDSLTGKGKTLIPVAHFLEMLDQK